MHWLLVKCDPRESAAQVLVGPAAQLPRQAACIGFVVAIGGRQRSSAQHNREEVALVGQ